MQLTSGIPVSLTKRERNFLKVSVKPSVILFSQSQGSHVENSLSSISSQLNISNLEFWENKKLK